MPRLLDAEDAFDPSDDLVRGRVRGLVEVDDTVADVVYERTLERGVAGGDGSVVTGTDVEAVVVLEEEGPLGCVDGGGEALGLDHVVSGVGWNFFDFCHGGGWVRVLVGKRVLSDGGGRGASVGV